MFGYTELSGYLLDWYGGLGYSPLPTMVPGPGGAARIKSTPGRLVLVTFTPGAGTTTEYVFDRPSVQLRTAGNQLDYDDAEKLAFDTDRGMLAVDHSQRIAGYWVTSIVRSGGRPSVLEIDDADRWHFTGNYIIETEAGLDG